MVIKWSIAYVNVNHYSGFVYSVLLARVITATLGHAGLPKEKPLWIVRADFYRPDVPPVIATPQC